MSSPAHTIQAKLLHIDGITVYDDRMNPVEDDWINQTSVVVGIARKRSFSVSGPSVPLQLLGIEGNALDNSPEVSYFTSQWTNSAGKGNFLKWETKFMKKQDSEILETKIFDISIGLVRGSEKIPLGVCKLAFAGPALMTQMDLPIQLIEPKTTEDYSDGGNMLKSINSRLSNDSSSIFSLKKSSSSIRSSSSSSSVDTVSTLPFGSATVAIINGIQTVQFKSDSRGRRYGLRNAMIRVNVMCLPTKQFVNLASFQSKVKKEIQKEPSAQVFHDSTHVRGMNHSENRRSIRSTSPMSRKLSGNAGGARKSRDLNVMSPSTSKHHGNSPQILGTQSNRSRRSEEAGFHSRQCLASELSTKQRDWKQASHTKHEMNSSTPRGHVPKQKEAILPGRDSYLSSDTSGEETENDENQLSRANGTTEVKETKPLQGILKTYNNPRPTSRHRRANPSPKRVEFVNFCSGKSKLQKETPSPKTLKKFSSLRF